MALNPDLVFATDEGNREETVRQLERLGIPIYLVHANRIAETIELIARVGELTGRDGRRAAPRAARCCGASSRPARRWRRFRARACSTCSGPIR